MNNLLLFFLIAIFGFLPISIVIVYFFYRHTIALPIAIIVFSSAVFCSLMAFVIGQKGFVVLVWIAPICALGLVALHFVIRKIIQTPLVKLRDNIDLSSKGILDINIDKRTLNKSNEIGAIAVSFQHLLNVLNEASKFSDEIANGNLDLDYKLMSDKDRLGLALLNMRDSLIEARNKGDERKAIEEQQNWITNGIAKFSDILRSDLDVKNLSELFLSKLIDYLNANQGGLFIVNNENEEDVYYELVGCIAYERKKLIHKKFRIGEGLIGRCAYERLTISLTEIPENYVNITSGLGSSNPRSLILIPAIINDKVYAVMELASFHKIEKYQIEFLEKIGENIASSISTLKINEQTQRLLTESKQQSEELAAQEEEMRQNLEELQATQEEMQRKERELLSINEELLRKIQLLDPESHLEM